MSSAPIYITIDPNSPAFIVYHDHSYFIRHEPTNSSSDNVNRRKSSTSNTKPVNTIQHHLHQQQQSQTRPISQQGSLPSVQVLNRLLLEHQQKLKNSSTDSTVNPSQPSTNTIDISAILRALLAKQNHHISSVEKTVINNSEDATCSSTLSSSSSLTSMNTSQMQPDPSSTAAS